MRAIQAWLDRFCQQHPRFAIPGLMRFIIAGNALIYFLDMMSFSRMACSSLFLFDSGLIFQGQVWRIITFIFVPQANMNIFFFALTLYFYYFIGTALEQQWGSVKFTVFYLLGIVLNILVGLLIGTATMFYVNLSLFFSFATLYPNLQFLLFFLIPVKAKWLAWFDAALFAFSIVGFLYRGYYLLALMPLIAILNYFLFFAQELMGQASYIRQKNQHRHSSNTINFKEAQKHSREKNGYLHKCAVCGRTDVSNPELEFRYCSRCNGYYCYCQDHINSHEHIL